MSAASNPLNQHRRFFVLAMLLGSWIALADCRPAAAAQFAMAQVEHNGVVVLQGSFTARDTDDLAAVWKLLIGQPLKAVGSVVPDVPNAHVATLTGDIRLTITSLNPKTSVTVNRLRLLRVPGKENEWQLPPEEVEQTAKAAGLDIRLAAGGADPDAAPGWVLPVVFGLIALGGLIALVLWSRSHSAAGMVKE